MSQSEYTYDKFARFYDLSKIRNGLEILTKLESMKGTGAELPDGLSDTVRLAVITQLRREVAIK